MGGEAIAANPMAGGEERGGGAERYYKILCQLPTKIVRQLKETG